VDLSGIIFVVLALAWAVYLIPKALKHHDEVARTRSVDRFSTAMRVLARREPIDHRNARLVVTPARSAERVIVPTRPAAPQPSAGARRAAARAAARRRRRVTLFLIGVVAIVAVVAAFSLVPWWSVAIPVALTFLYLVLCRRQVRREKAADPAAVGARVGADERAAAPDSAPRRAVRVEAPYGSVQTRRQAVAHHDELSADEDTVQIPVEALEAVAVAVETVDDGSLWDPLPVTLPTYVNKARAARTVRTIDLSAPGTWTSGRDESDSALVEQATVSETVDEMPEAEPRRAVGS
jgi:hypothetical protein